MAFHVPEAARILQHPTHGSTAADGNNGAFLLESPEPGWQLITIASDGRDIPGADVWEHVSVHAINGRKSRTPNWREMCFVKDLFWDAEDVVMQLHPAKSEYVNTHPNVLHLWRPASGIPTPPRVYV